MILHLKIAQALIRNGFKNKAMRHLWLAAGMASVECRQHIMRAMEQLNAL
jgi:hypothetical protein